MQQIASQNAPSVSLVIPHFVFGGFAWFCMSLMVILFPETFTQHYFNDALLSLTHLIVLGWISMVIFGALYQLIPVVIEVKLFSEKLAKISFFLLAIGSLLLSFSFWQGLFGLILYLSGGFVLVSVSIFVVNIFITGSRQNKKSISFRMIKTSIIWLAFTVVAGFLLAINLRYTFLEPSHLELLKLHAHAGIIGWFLLLVMGVGSKLFPMFLVSQKLKTKALHLAFYLINISLIIGFIALYLNYDRVVLGAVVVGLSGGFSFIYFVYFAFKNRIKKKLDIGMKHTKVSFIFLSTAIILMILLYVIGDDRITVRMSLAYGATLIIGFFTLLIMGQTFKTLPFIIWLKLYKDKVGKFKIPFPKDLYSERIASIQLWIFSIGFIVFIIAIFIQIEWLVRLGGLLLFFSSCLYLYNLIKIVLQKPKFKHLES